MADLMYDSSSSRLWQLAEPVHISTNMVYDPAPRDEADVPHVVEVLRPPAELDGAPATAPPWAGSAWSYASEDAFVPKLTAPAAPPAAAPAILTYGDLEALEAAALLAVGEGLLAPPDPDADPWDEEEDAAASRRLAVAWQKLNHARRDGRGVVVEPNVPDEWGRTDDH